MTSGSLDSRPSSRCHFERGILMSQSLEWVTSDYKGKKKVPNLKFEFDAIGLIMVNWSVPSKGGSHEDNSGDPSR
jgi:hypothetical protein